MTVTPEFDAFPELVKLINRRFMQDPYGDLAELRESRAATPVENNGMRIGNAEQLADDPHRHDVPEVGGKVKSATSDVLVQHPGAQPPHIGLKCGYLLLAEHSRQQSAEDVVGRRIVP